MSKAILAMRHYPSPPQNIMSNKLDALALDQLFRTARTRSGWTDRPVELAEDFPAEQEGMR